MHSYIHRSLEFRGIPCSISDQEDFPRGLLLSVLKFCFVGADALFGLIPSNNCDHSKFCYIHVRMFTSLRHITTQDNRIFSLAS